MTTRVLFAGMDGAGKSTLACSVYAVLKSRSIDVGLHAGPVVFQEGDYFGRTVNGAARIADEARPGEVLVSQEVVDAAAGTPVTFREIGSIELKGVSRPFRLHAASPLR